MISSGKDETEILQLKKHWMFFGFPIVVAFCMGLISLVSLIIISGDRWDRLDIMEAFVVSIAPVITFILPWFLYTLARYYVDEILLTNQKFHVRVGLIIKEVISTPLQKINNVSYHQGIFGRIFGYGTINVHSAAMQGVSSYSYIINPESVRSTIEQAIEQKEST